MTTQLQAEPSSGRGTKDLFRVLTLRYLSAAIVLGGLPAVNSFHHAVFSVHAADFAFRASIGPRSFRLSFDPKMPITIVRGVGP